VIDDWQELLKYSFLLKTVNEKYLLNLQKNKMSYADKHIVETYSILFDGLSSLSKIELIEKLTKSLKKEKMAKKDTFFESFGAFSDEKTAEEIISDLKSSRKFRNQEIKL
jgi:hypothetical protein